MQVDVANNTEASHMGAGLKKIKVSTESEIAAREAAIDRANFYATLGALFAAPASEEHCQVLKDLAPIENPETSIELAWTLISKAAHDYTSDQINDEYHDLFIGVGRGIVVPYGSWHMTGFLMEKPLGLLRADLRRLGFERSEGVKESEDHIASLCQAMSEIIVAEEIDFDTEQAFFNDHIAPWAEDFFTLVENASVAAFYRAVAQLGKSFIEVEKKYLAMAV